MEFLSQVLGPARVPRLIFGCASVGGRVSARDATRAMAIAFDHEVVAFDTARSYGYGEAEAVLGEFMRGRRERCVVITKAGIRAKRPGRLRAAKSAARAVFSFAPGLRRVARKPLGQMQQGGHFAPEQVRASLEESLAALATDYVDAFLTHGAPPSEQADADLRGLLEGLRSEGKIRAYGMSSRPAALRACPWHPLEVAEYPVSAAWADPDGMLGVASIRLANKVYKGAESTAQHVVLGSEISPADRHEILLRAPVVSGRADAVVVSMLQPEHILANVKAFSCPSATTCEALASWTKGRAKE